MASVMLDLETLATTHDAVVLTIGAVKFNAFSLQEPFDELYMRVNIDEQIAKGRDIEEATMTWWGNQEPVVQEEAFSSDNRESVADMLNALNKFLVGVDKIWCQGPHFDITILETLFKQYGIPRNWDFWQIMDSRTLFSVHGDPRDKNSKTLHNAVEDCKSQARGVQQTFRKLGITKYAGRI
jgi:DNA polymerase III epsilon subunit-like protein